MKDGAFPGRVFFDHLPKTGGTAVTGWLRQELGSGCVTPYHLWGKHFDLIRQYGGVYSVISAHADFRDSQELDLRYQYITVFRDPVDRVVSWLYFTINNIDNSAPQSAAMIKLVHRFLDSDGKDIPKELISEISNLYVAHFCSTPDNRSRSEDERIAHALAAIKRYDVVGVYEEMPEFLREVAGLIGLAAPKAIDRVHTTLGRPKVDQLSPALRESIMTLNELDLRLYNEVVAWKKSTARGHASKHSKVSVSRWKKYDPKLNRVVVTPDVIIAGALLREGEVIRRRQLMTFCVDFLLVREVRNLEMGIHILDSDRRCAFGTNSTLLGQSHRSVPGGSYRVSHHLVADLPAGMYTAGFAFAERLPEGLRELAWHDVLCRFRVIPQVAKPFAGYSYLPAEISLSPTGLTAPAITQPTGQLKALEPALSMAAGSRATIGVEICNCSDQRWVGDIFRPVNLSYHWFKDSGEVILGDGLRTPLPEGGVGPGRSVVTEVLVEAPKETGKHTLVLTMVQENVAWFENIGLEPARIEVGVL
jgi:hypothetical protein